MSCESTIWKKNDKNCFYLFVVGRGTVQTWKASNFFCIFSFPQMDPPTSTSPVRARRHGAPVGITEGNDVPRFWSKLLLLQKRKQSCMKIWILKKKEMDWWKNVSKIIPGGFARFLPSTVCTHWFLHFSASQKIPPPHVAWVPSGAIEVVDLAWKHPLGNGKFSRLDFWEDFWEKLIEGVNGSNF